MRKLTLLFAAALSFNYAANAQKGIELGAEFTPMTTWILNNEDFDQGADLNFRGTFGFLTGLSAGYNITDGFGIQTGFMYNKCGQNYITDYDNVAKADQNTYKRSLSYFRVPVLFKVNGTGETGGMYFRIGPHFDFLNSAKYSFTDNEITPVVDIDYSIDKLDLKNFEGLDPDATTYPLTTDTRKYEIYKGFVVGATLELGGSVNINENMKIVFMLHLEGSLTNPEGKDAAYVRAAYAYDNPSTLLSSRNPGVIYPANPVGSAYERSTAWQVGGGLNVGFHYIIPVGN